MKQQLINLRTRDRLNLQGVFFCPDTVARTGNAVLHLHDWFGWFYSDWEYVFNTAQYLADQGHCFLSMNTRGCGAAWTCPSILGLTHPPSQTRWLGGGYELFDECIQDIRAGIAFLIGEACPDIVLEGVGLGASKAVYYQSYVQDPKVKSVIVNSPRDFVGTEISQPDFEQTLSNAERLLAGGKGDEPVAKIFGHPVSASSYLGKFGVDARNKGIHWLDVLREQSPHPIDRISDPVLVLRALEEDELCKSDFLPLIKGRVIGRCETTDVKTLYQEYAPQNDINRVLAEVICDWVDDILP